MSDQPAMTEVCCRELPDHKEGPCTWPETDCWDKGPGVKNRQGLIPESWRHALDDLWGCIGKREMEHLQPETVRLAKVNHEALWHTHDGPVCYADGLPWWHPHHFATVKSPNE